MEKTDKKKLIKFIAWTFGIAWVLQAASIYVVKTLPDEVTTKMIYTLITSLSMFAPAIAVLLTCKNFKEISWKIKGKKVFSGVLIAFFSLTILIIVGAVAYYLIFPDKFSLGSPQALALLTQARDMNPQVFILLYFLAAALGGGFVNMFFALGEEIGWTGFLVPILSKTYSKAKSIILRGVIWGIWHWPLIALIGYEYGTGYFGAPFTGMLLMLVFTTSLGAIIVWLYDYSGSIWVPAFAHGMLNAVAGFPLAFLAEGNTSYLIGPTLPSLLSGLLLFIVGFSIIANYAKKGKQNYCTNDLK